MYPSHYRVFTLANAEYFPWIFHLRSSWWVSWSRTRHQPFWSKWGFPRGLKVRAGPLGFAFHFGPGVYHNGKKWIVFHFDEYQDYLDKGGV